MSGSLIDALGVQAVETYRSKQDFLVIVENQKQLMLLTPDFSKLLSLDLRAVIVSSRADGGKFDFVSRFFAPKCGVPEDPVTGSAHCILTPYWAKKLAKTQLRAKQLSQRGGELLCEMHGDRVYLQGKAVAYMQGKIKVCTKSFSCY